MGLLNEIFTRLRSFLLYHSMLFINYILLIYFLKSIPVDFEVLGSLVLSYILTGVGAFLLNDYYDKKVDLKAGKSNLAEKANSYFIGFIVLLGFSVSFFLGNRISENAGILLLVQFVALLAYSHPRIRLKSKPIFGIIADSIYAYIIPVLLLFVVYKIEIADPKYLAFLLFNFSIGLRDILLHQKKDELNDLKSGINSFAIRYKSKVNTLVYISEFTASLSLCFFLMFGFWKLESQTYVLGIGVAYLFILLFEIFRVQKSIENNYLIRFYIVISTFILGYWLLNENLYAYLILLIHPYLYQFVVQIFQLINQLKIMISVVVNYSLYYSFKLMGRDLKKKPLYKKHEKKNSN